jgi:hypothetical protein
MRPVRIIWLLAAGGLAAGIFLWRQSGEPAQAIVVPCADVVAGCGLPEGQLRVRFDRHPRSMQKFMVIVEFPDVRNMYARFAMQGMEMGLNRYRFLPDGEGRWHAEVMLPVCVQGRSDWKMVLEADGTRYEVPFSSR